MPHCAAQTPSMHVIASSTPGQVPSITHDMQQVSTQLCMRPSPAHCDSTQVSEGVQ